MRQDVVVHGGHFTRDFRITAFIHGPDGNFIDLKKVKAEREGYEKNDFESIFHDVRNPRNSRTE